MPRPEGRVISASLANQPTARAALAHRWPEYAIEAATLGLFMLAVCLVGALLEHPLSPLHAALPNAVVRRAVMGLAMGLTAAGLIYSPMGQRSGAHMNPAVTLTFWYLGKLSRWDALFYMLFQLLGGLAGVGLGALLLQGHLADASLGYFCTLPGPAGAVVAAIAEGASSYLLMLLVLEASNHPAIARYTGAMVGVLVALMVTFESPLSGFGINPARTLASAIPAGNYTAIGLYLWVPPLAMWLAAVSFQRLRGLEAVLCAKLHPTRHDERACICGHPPRPPAPARSAEWPDAV